MIALLDLLIFAFIVLVLLTLFTQVIVPLKDGTPLFPFFSKDATHVAVKHVREELEHVAELEQLDELQEELNRRKAQLKKEDENE